jgi:hypothetical protein
LNATFYFELIANAVAISVRETNAITIIARVWVIAITRVRRCWIEVAGFSLLTADFFFLVTDTILVHIEQAISITVKAGLWKDAASIFISGRCHEVARLRCCATRNFKFIANAIVIRICEAISCAIVARVRVITITRVCSRGVIVTCSRILATGQFNFIADPVLVHIEQAVSITVEARLGEDATFIFVRGRCHEVARLRCSAPRNFKLIANAITV